MRRTAEESLDLSEKSRYPKVLMEQTGIQKMTKDRLNGIRLLRHTDSDSAAISWEVLLWSTFTSQ